MGQSPSYVGYVRARVGTIVMFWAFPLYGICSMSRSRAFQKLTHTISFHTPLVGSSHFHMDPRVSRSLRKCSLFACLAFGRPV